LSEPHAIGAINTARRSFRHTAQNFDSEGARCEYGRAHSEDGRKLGSPSVARGSNGRGVRNGPPSL